VTVLPASGRPGPRRVVLAATPGFRWACGGRLTGPLARRVAIQDCVERRRLFEAEQPGVTIVTPARPDDRWRAVLPLGVLPDDGTTIGARSLCDLMDKLDRFYPDGSGGTAGSR
jgi:hypothetical protein